MKPRRHSHAVRDDVCDRRGRVFVADLSSERAGLGKAKMVRVGRRAAAHDAGLAGHEFGMFLVAQANGLAHDAAADGRISSWTSAKTSAPFAPCMRGSTAGATWTALIGVSCACSSASASTFALKRLRRVARRGSPAGSCRAVAGEPSSPPRRRTEGHRVRQSDDRVARRIVRLPERASRGERILACGSQPASLWRRIWCAEAPGFERQVFNYENMRRAGRLGVAPLGVL